MKLYNMRNNKELGTFSQALLDFLSKHLLENGESNEDFFVTYNNIKVLEDNASSDEEKNLIKIVKEALEKEIGKTGIDVYYE